MPALTSEEILVVAKAVQASRADSGDCPKCLVGLVEQWGGTVPPPRPKTGGTVPPPKPKATPPAHSEPTVPTDETDPEVVPPETDAPVAMGPDVAPELSEAEEDQLSELKQKANQELSSGNFAIAVELFTKILLKAPSPLVYAKRAETFVKQKKTQPRFETATPPSR